VHVCLVGASVPLANFYVQGSSGCMRRYFGWSMHVSQECGIEKWRPGDACKCLACITLRTPHVMTNVQPC